MSERRTNKRLKLTRKARDAYRGKKCLGKCGQRLTLNSFAKNASKEDGLKSYCRDCRGEYRRDHKEKNKESHERYRIRHGIHRTFKELGWEKRYAELRATGSIVTAKKRLAIKEYPNIRLVCGELMICKPRKAKSKCRQIEPKE